MVVCHVSQWAVLGNTSTLLFWSLYGFFFVQYKPIRRLPSSEESDKGEIEPLILKVISHFDQGEGVQYQTIMSNALSKGFDREAAEAGLDDLLQKGDIDEPRFGWFIMNKSQ